MNIINEILLLFLLISFVSAQIDYTPLSGPASDLSKVWYSVDFPWQVIAVIAVFISFSFAALALMFGRLFQSSDLEKLAKAEFAYALSTVVLLAFIIIFVDILATKSIEFVSLISNDREALKLAISKDPSPFAVAEYYMNRTLICAQTRYQEGFCLLAPLMVLTSIGKSQTTGITTKDSALGSMSKYLTSSSFMSQIGKIGLQIPIITLTRLLSDLSYIIFIFFFQKNALLFIQQTMLTVFLPAGIALRGFPVVRSVGNMLIAVAIGMYFVYPISYSILLVMGTGPGGVDTLCGIAGIEEKTDLTILPCSSLIIDFFRFSSNVISKTIGQADVSASLISNTLSELQRLIGEMVIFGVVYPFIAVVLTYTFIKSFSIFLNVDAQEFAEGLVKLI